MKKKPLKLKAVKAKGEWGNGLAAFRERHQLSWREFASIFDGAISRRSLHRLCNGNGQPRFIHFSRPMMRDSLRRYLEKKGVDQEQISWEMCSVFCKEELEPMITHRAVLTRPAQEFFKLRLDPFTGEPKDASEVFTTPDLDRCLAHVMESVKFQGFNAVIGTVGSGKTTLKRRAVDVCNTSNGKYRILFPEFMNMEKVHAGSIASFVLREFGETKVPRDLVQRAGRLKQLLVRLSRERKCIALGFDECHRLDPRLLTALKNFWELGDGGFDRYIGLVLFGQTRFNETLADPEFQEISERLNIIRLPILGKHASNYLSHRLTYAGGKLEKLFQPAALTRMVKLANTPLALGNVANAALMKAYEKGSLVVLPDFIPDGPDADPKARSVRAA